MSLLKSIRDKYKQTAFFREVVKAIPFAGGPLDALIATADGPRYFTAIDGAFIKKQRSRKVESILDASVGDWPMIAHNIDIRRDLHNPLVSSIKKHLRNPALLIILGVPGAGKTTLLRRIGSDLVAEGISVFELRAGAKATPEWLNYISTLPKKGRSLPVLLINDIFRYEGIEDILVDSDIGCVIVANSRLNEDRTNSLRTTRSLVRIEVDYPSHSMTGWPILGEPSSRELSLLRRQPEFANIDNATWNVITTADWGTSSAMLVIMIRLSANGKPFDQIVGDVLRNLEHSQPATFRAFCVLCAFHSLGLATPTPVLELFMVGHSGFTAQLRRSVVEQEVVSSASGLVFPGDYVQYHESWQTAHELIAETASNTEFGSQIESIYDEFWLLADAADEEQLGFASWLFLALAKSKTHLASNYLEKRPKLIDALVAGDPRLNSLWSLAFWKLGDHKRSAQCLKNAVASTPSSAVTLIELHCQIDDGDAALNVATDWLNKHPDDTTVRTRYIGLVETKGNSNQVEDILAETKAWLNAHPDDTAVRTRYIGLVETKGTSKQVEDVLAETKAWLNEHPDDTAVRTRYIGLVATKGTSKQVEDVVAETKAWLNKHPDDTTVRTRYIGLVESKGTSKQVEDVLAATKAWLNMHPDDTDVRTRYIGLVETKGTSKQVEDVLAETKACLNGHPDDTTVRTRYIGLVESKGTSKQVEDVLAEIRAWLNKHPDDIYVRTRYIRLVESKGTIAQVEAALRGTALWLESRIGDDAILSVFSIYFRLVLSHQLEDMLGHESVMKLLNERPDEGQLVQYARYLHKQEKLDEAEEIFRNLTKDDDPLIQAGVFHGYGRLLLDRGDHSGALKQFRSAIAKNRGFQIAYDGIASALAAIALDHKSNGSFDLAERFFKRAEAEFKNAIHCAEHSKESVNIFYVHLGRFYLDWDKPTEALSAFEIAVNDESPDFYAHWGAAKALIALGDLDKAKIHVRTAIEKAPENLGPPASVELPQLLDQCE